MELTDTHCHLGDIEAPRREEIFRNAAEHQITRFVCIGSGENTLSAEQSVQLAETRPDVWATVGIAPFDANTYTDHRAVEHLFAHPRVVAVGEVGLDFYRDWAPKQNQIALLESAIDAARRHKKPLIIHCRNAAEETLSCLINGKANEVGGVYHCYVEDADYAEKLAKINFLVSFTGIVTFKNAAAMRETVRRVPIERIMLETDTPYMAPEPFRGNPSEPMHVFTIAQKIAEIKGLPLEEVARITTSNARRLFGI